MKKIYYEDPKRCTHSDEGRDGAIIPKQLLEDIARHRRRVRRKRMDMLKLKAQQTTATKWNNRLRSIYVRLCDTTATKLRYEPVPPEIQQAHATVHGKCHTH